MQTGTQRKQPEHPPLARDAQGNLLEIPEGTAAWRVCRQTTGRPREIVGPDKQPMRFPLDITGDELADLCGPDVYRLYALDDVGKVLDYVATIDVSRETRELRNNAATEATALASTRAAPATSTSDLRFALEAMAQMMRVNSEALRAVAESQADWVKSVASTRGFFWNAPYLPPPPPPAPDDGDDEEEYDELPPSKTIYDVLAPIAEHLAPTVKPLVSMLTSGAGSAPRNTGNSLPAGEPSDADADLAAKPNWEMRDLVDLNYAAAKAKAKKAAKQSSGNKRSLQARLMSDPQLLSHFMAIKALLESDEVMQIVALADKVSEQEQEWLLAQVKTLPPQEAAQLLRALLVEMDAAKAETNESAT